MGKIAHYVFASDSQYSMYQYLNCMEESLLLVVWWFSFIFLSVLLNENNYVLYFGYRKEWIMIKYRQSHFHHSVGEFGMDIKTSMCWQHNHAGYQYHGEPSETDDCSHPLPKMATAENSTLCKNTFDHIIRHGSLRFWPASLYWIYLTSSDNNSRSPCARTALQCMPSHFSARGGWLDQKRRLTNYQAQLGGR